MQTFYTKFLHLVRYDVYDAYHNGGWDDDQVVESVIKCSKLEIVYGKTSDVYGSD